MLRGLLLALVAANLLFLAWAQGWLAPTWPGPRASQAEPLRLASQVNPEWVQVLPAGAASQKVAGARRAALRCLEAGPFTEETVAAAEASLAGAGLGANSVQRLAGAPASAQASAQAGAQAGAQAEVWLRSAAADAALQTRLLALPADALGGGFKPCRAP